MKKRFLSAFAMFALALMVVVSPAMAFTFLSTNDVNRNSGLPHVNLVSSGPGTVTLEFVVPTDSLAYFEYRIDGNILTSGTAHPIVTGDFMYPGLNVDNRGSTPQVPTTTRIEQEFTAGSTVEIRHALGGENDWYFDWVIFDVPPITKEACQNGGWEAMGFSNQGQCIRYVNTGVDPREP